MLRRILATTVWLLLAFPAGTALAQQTATVTGTVVDSTSSIPLPGVNVIIDGTSLGAATDVQGRYTITGVPTGAQVLRASYISYQPRRVPITVQPGENVVNIRLAQDVRILGDIVVTALGIERAERSLGYSVQQVDGAALALVPQQNFVSALQGRVAGANFYTSNSMGGSTRVVLRGPRSFAGNNQPLIVVDGIPLDNSTFTTVAQERGAGGFDYGNAAQLINPDNVESVTVLQGATAAALYGSRAANGVIQIVTRSGRRQQGIGIQVNSSLTANTIYALPNYQNDFGGGMGPQLTTNGDFLLGANEQLFSLYAMDQSWGPRLDGRNVRQWYSFDDVDGLEGVATPWVAFPNNVRDFFNTGVTQNTTVAFSQGAENFNYRLSYTRFDVEDVFPNGNLTRNQFALNGGVNLSPRLRVGALGNYVTSDALGRSGTGYSGANVFQQFNHFGQRNLDLSATGPMGNYRRADGSQRGWNWRNTQCAQPGSSCPQGRLIYFDNPYWIRNESFQNDGVRRFFGNASVAYELTGDITVSGEVRTDQYTDRRQQRNATGSQGLDSYLVDIRQVQESGGLARIQADRNITPDLSITGFVGSEYRYNTYSRNAGQTASGLSAPNLFSLENSRDRPTIVDYQERKAVFGVFGEVTLGYQDLAYVTATARNDWSSALPTENNSYLYPSATASFVFSSLPAFQRQDILSFGKLRAGLAQTGNDTDPYRTALTYPVQTPLAGNPVQTLPGARNNLNLRPERTTEYTTGAELQFFSNRVGIDVTYYYEISQDQILPVDVSRTSGFNQLVLNTGRMDNEGVAVELTGTPVLSRDFRWDVGANFSRNRNTVVSLNEDLGLEFYNLSTAPFGPQIGARVGQPYGAMFGTGFTYDDNGNMVFNANGRPVVAPAAIIGNYQPDYTYGFNTSVAFRNFSANALFSGQIGGDIFSVSNLFGFYSGILQETVDGDIRERGIIPVGVTPSGDPFTTRIEAVDFFQQLFGIHEAFLYDATHLRLQEVALSYTLPQRWFGTVPVQGLTVSAIGRNLGTLYKRTPNFDPAEALSATNVQGIEAGQLPPQRSFGMSIQFSF